MDEIKQMLITMQNDIKQQKQDMEAMKEDIKNAINSNINEKFKYLELKSEQLEKQIEEQSEKIKSLERYNRRRNIVMFGVEEREKSYHELEDIIIDLIQNHFKLKCDKSYFEGVRRLGKKGEKTRPIVISFTTLGFKITILQNKSCLNNTSYYIKEDYPKDILIKRKELQEQLMKEREAGNIAFIKYDKLIITKSNKDISRKQLNKRNLSESPETSNSNYLNNQRGK